MGVGLLRCWNRRRPAGVIRFDMVIRSRAALGIAAVTMAAVAILSTSAWADRTNWVGKHPSHAVENCSTQSRATFPHAFTSPQNLVVGPLSLTGAGGSPSFVWNSKGSEGFQKFPLLVKAGHRVTLELSPTTRLRVGLAYGPLPQGETYLRDTYRVVTFIACTRMHSMSSADGQPVTFWSGSVLARTPRCGPLLVWVDGKRSPRRAVIRLGVRRCG
jgi:hypothetical protein